MTRADVIVHGVVAVVFLTAVTVLGALRVLDAAAVVAMLASGGGIVGVLSVADRISYGARNGSSSSSSSSSPPL